MLELILPRSIAIDALTAEFQNDEVAVLHVYFDYKAQKAQTAVNIAHNLLKQLLSRLDYIPLELQNSHSANTKPSLDESRTMLSGLTDNFRTIYAIFDAIDECDVNQLNEIVAGIAGLGPNCKVLISTRPHLLQHLRNELPNANTLEISANEKDLQNYIMSRLAEKGNRDRTLETKCLELSTGADGMYFYFDVVLKVGFCWRSSN